MNKSIPLVLVLLAAGCADPSPDEVEVATFEETDLSSFAVRAVYRGPALGGAAMTVDHEEIPGRMPAMRMDLALEDPGLIEGLEPGDKLDLTLVERDVGDGFIVTGVDLLPGGIELDLEGTGADSVFVIGS